MTLMFTRFAPPCLYFAISFNAADIYKAEEVAMAASAHDMLRRFRLSFTIQPVRHIDAF